MKRSDGQHDLIDLVVSTVRLQLRGQWMIVCRWVSVKTLKLLVGGLGMFFFILFYTHPDNTHGK